MKAQKSRREQFSGAGPVVSDLPPAALAGGPFGAAPGGAKGSVLLRDAMQKAHGNDAVAIDMGAAEQQLTHRGGHQMQQLMFADETESYLQSRTDAVQSIESTIVELGGIFQQLALMVREQEEMVQRYGVHFIEVSFDCYGYVIRDWSLIYFTGSIPMWKTRRRMSKQPTTNCFATFDLSLLIDG